MEKTILQLLFAILIFQLLFVSFFLFQSKKGKALSNRLIALVFLMTAISIFNLYFMIFNRTEALSFFFYIDDSFMFAYGPLLLLFTQSLIIKDFKLNRTHLFHFIPYVLFLLFMLQISFSNNLSSELFQLTQSNVAEMPLIVHLGELAMLLHIFSYLIFSKLELRIVVVRAKNSSSKFYEEDFKWLSFILNSFIIIFLASTLHSILPLFGVVNALSLTLFLLIVLIFYFVNSALFKMLNQSANDSGILSREEFVSIKKYAGSKLSSAELEKMKLVLNNYMTNDKKYMKSEISISQLSADLGIASKRISQIINEGFNCNFFDFVNKYRVEEAKRRLQNNKDEKLTILEVMYECGFNSKSSFNTAFKKFTNMTPTEFKQKQ